MHIENLLYSTAVSELNVQLLLNLTNHPNPFNPTTEISYQVSGDSDVLLKIYNVKGQIVNTLVNEFKSAGEHSIIWNGRDDREQLVESGIYLYQLKAGNEVVSRKMILLK